MIKVKIKIIFWKFVIIISFKLSEGKKPPEDTRVIVKFSELNNLTPEIFSNIKIIELRMQ